MFGEFETVDFVIINFGSEGTFEEFLEISRMKSNRCMNV